MDSKYSVAFGFLESAVHRALRELESSRPVDAQAILIGALADLHNNHCIELHWPDDAKEHGDGTV